MWKIQEKLALYYLVTNLIRGIIEVLLAPKQLIPAPYGIDFWTTFLAGKI